MAEETNIFRFVKIRQIHYSNDEQQSDVVITPPTTKFDSSKYDKYLTTDDLHNK